MEQREAVMERIHRGGKRMRRGDIRRKDAGEGICGHDGMAMDQEGAKTPRAQLWGCSSSVVRAQVAQHHHTLCTCTMVIEAQD